jgi:hypothetical protein
MRTLTPGKALAALAVALLLGACGSSDIGDILGGPSGRAADQIRGTVRSVDTRGDCRIELDDTGSSRYLANGGSGSGGRATVYCDSSTRVVYQGQTYRPDSLEAGDEVVVAVRDVGGRLLADRIDVTYDVSTRGYDDRYPRDDRYDEYGRTANEDLRGTVLRVDRERRNLTLERVDYYDRSLDPGGSSDRLTLYYDSETRVTFRGQGYRPENLEPGDVVAVSVETVRGTLVASDVRVLADTRDTASYPR